MNNKLILSLSMLSVIIPVAVGNIFAGVVAVALVFTLARLQEA